MRLIDPGIDNGDLDPRSGVLNSAQRVPGGRGIQQHSRPVQIQMMTPQSHHALHAGKVLQFSGPCLGRGHKDGIGQHRH